MNPRAMLAGDLFPLVGPPLPERLTVRVQKKSSLPAFQVVGLGCVLITHSHKKVHDYGNRKSGLSLLPCDVKMMMITLRGSIPPFLKRVLDHILLTGHCFFFFTHLVKIQ